jgi:hypothetical protein
MSAILRVTGADLQYLSSQLNVLADELHSTPYIHVGGLRHCGSGLVATAAAGANEHFALRALLIETELRDLGAMAVHVDSAMGDQDAGLSAASGGGW